MGGDAPAMIRHVYLTSFQKSHALPPGVELRSAAVYQPTGYAYPKVDWTDIRADGHHWIRPRDFIGNHEPLLAYRQALLNVYLGRLDAARAWAQSLTSDVALCCWCPYDKAAQRQLHQFGSFVCHTAVVGEFIYNFLDDLRVWEDEDRRSMAVLTQR